MISEFQSLMSMMEVGKSPPGRPRNSTAMCHFQAILHVPSSVANNKDSALSERVGMIFGAKGPTSSYSVIAAFSKLHTSQPEDMHHC